MSERHCRIHGNYGFFLGSSGGCPSCKSDRADQKRDRENAHKQADGDRRRAKEEADSARYQANLARERDREQAGRNQERSREEAQSRRWENQWSREDRPQRAYQLTTSAKFGIWQYNERERRENEERAVRVAQEKKSQEEREAAEKERLEREAIAEREHQELAARELKAHQEKSEKERLAREATMREDKLNSLIRPALRKAEGWVKAYGELQECAEIISLWRSMLAGDSWSLNDLIRYEKKIIQDQKIVNDAFARRVEQIEKNKKEQERQEKIEAQFQEVKMLMRDNKPDLALLKLREIIDLSPDYIAKVLADGDFKAYENYLAAFLSAMREEKLRTVIRPALERAEFLVKAHGKMKECEEIIARWQGMIANISWGLNDIVLGLNDLVRYEKQIIQDYKIVNDAFARRVQWIDKEKKERERQERCRQANEAIRAEEERKQFSSDKMGAVAFYVVLVGLIIILGLIFIDFQPDNKSVKHTSKEVVVEKKVGQSDVNKKLDDDIAALKARLEKLGFAENDDLSSIDKTSDLSNLAKSNDLSELATIKHLTRVKRKLNAHLADDDEIIVPVKVEEPADPANLNDLDVDDKLDRMRKRLKLSSRKLDAHLE